MTEPTSYNGAIKDSNWCKAMTNELTTLELNNTWSFIDLPPHKEAIGCKWIFKIKYNYDGTIERYKAQLVAKRYTQQEVVDCHETFYPMANVVSWS